MDEQFDRYGRDRREPAYDDVQSRDAAHGRDGRDGRDERRRTRRSRSSHVRTPKPLARPSQPARHVDALDGLRALCALAVVGYHMGLSWLSGGLLGVTALFVLSGYLATDSILNAYARDGSFSLRDYYLRRLRRLMPQAILCVVVTAAACTLFDHVLLTKMRPDVIPALLMYLNWAKILSHVSYFAAAGAPSPLTHFWSLAIEWQFYLVWPLVLLLLMKLRAPKRGVRGALLALAVVSAVLMAVLYTPGEDPSRSYYGTDTRAMSLLLGCWLAFVLPMRDDATVGFAQAERRIPVEAVGAGSVGALIVLMVTTEGYTAFSYYGGVALASLLAVAATGALLPEGTLVSRVLSLPPLVWLGQRSYALYLWHYPIVLLLTDYGSTTGTPAWMRVVQLALSLGAAELTYRFVERPCGERGAITGAVRRLAADIRDRGAQLALRSHARTLVPGALICVLALVGLLVLPPVQAVGHPEGSAEGRHTDTTTTTLYDVLLIGDSVPLDAYDQLAATFPYALIDCRISRQMSEGIELVRTYVAQGNVGDDVVICLGSNGVVTQDQLDELLAAVGKAPSGEMRTLWLVNNRMPDEWQDANNELFESFAALHDNVRVIDWYGTSAGHDDWFWADGEHPTPDGAVAYAACIQQAMGYVAPTEAPTVSAQSAGATGGTEAGATGGTESGATGGTEVGATGGTEG